MKTSGVSPGGAYLTPRQVEVLSWLCEGLPNKLIARRLNISAATVKVHVGSILRELGVSSRLQAVVSARARGLLDGSPSEWPGYAAQAVNHAADTSVNAFFQPFASIPEPATRQPVPKRVTFG